MLPTWFNVLIPPIVHWMHLDKAFKFPFRMAVYAYVEVLVQENFASITVHVAIRQLLPAHLAKEITVAVSVKSIDR